MKHYLQSIPLSVLLAVALVIVIILPVAAIFCPQCGTRLGDEVKFCPNDGTNLTTYQNATGSIAPPQTSAAATPPPVVNPVPVVPQTPQGRIYYLQIEEGSKIRLRVFDFSTRRVRTLWADDNKPISFIAASPDGERLAIKYRDGRPGLFSAGKPHLAILDPSGHIITDMQRNLTPVAWSGDSLKLLCKEQITSMGFWSGSVSTKYFYGPPDNLREITCIPADAQSVMPLPDDSNRFMLSKFDQQNNFSHLALLTLDGQSRDLPISENGAITGLAISDDGEMLGVGSGHFINPGNNAFTVSVYRVSPNQSYSAMERPVSFHAQFSSYESLQVFWSSKVWDIDPTGRWLVYSDFADDISTKRLRIASIENISQSSSFEEIDWDEIAAVPSAAQGISWTR